jgi:hypothetical protein
MLRPPLDPDVDDLAPSDPALTDYDVEHLVCYLRLLVPFHRDYDGLF